MVLEHSTENYMTAWEPYKLPLWPCRMECYQQFIEALCNYIRLLQQNFN